MVAQSHEHCGIEARAIVQNLNCCSTKNELASGYAICFAFVVKNGYGQFCPIAKATEIFATRWTPLVLRELLSDAHTFTDIHHGVPLMSRALLVIRLQQLESDGLIEKRRRTGRRGSEYHLTAAGEGFRGIVSALGNWGMEHARSRITAHDLDPGLLLWAMRIRTDPRRLPAQRVVIRFEFSGVPANRTRFQLMWLILDRDSVDVCVKDPGFPVDLVARGPISAFVAVFVGNIMWNKAVGKQFTVEGDRHLAKQLPLWLRLDQMLGRDLPFVHYAP
jgi:DNA-binding HxlR family transcriptional regulator